MPCGERKASGTYSKNDAKKKYIAILMKSLKENLSFHWPVNVILAGALLCKPWLLWTSHCKYTVDFKSKLKLMSALTKNF